MGKLNIIILQSTTQGLLYIYIEGENFEKVFPCRSAMAESRVEGKSTHIFNHHLKDLVEQKSRPYQICGTLKSNNKALYEIQKSISSKIKKKFVCDTKVIFSRENIY